MSLPQLAAIRWLAIFLGEVGLLACLPVDLPRVMVVNPSAFDDGQSLESVLKELFPDDVRGRFAVCGLCYCGLLKQLRSLAEGKDCLSSAVLAELSLRAEAEFGLEPAIAEIGLRNYCLALGIAVKELLPQSLTLPLSHNVDLEMLWCPPGRFVMGSPESELGRFEDCDDEIQHIVTLSRGFYLGKYPVTQEQFLAVMGYRLTDLPCGSLTCPVDSIDWGDAASFCERLESKCSQQLPDGYKFALPTEAQWEYACRAGTTTALNSGKDLTSKYDFCANLDELGWFRENSSSRTHPVGLKLPNAWGFYDMHGNVWEWCYDWFDDFEVEREEDLISGDKLDPQGPRSGWDRLIRGGSIDYMPRSCRSASRHSIDPSLYYDEFEESGANVPFSNLGCRLAATPLYSRLSDLLD